MNEFKYVSDNYNLDKSINYRLSIQFNKDGFSVLVLSDQNHIEKIFHKNTGGIQGTIEELKDNSFITEVTRLSFKKIVLSINDSRFSLLPNNDFSLIEAKGLLSLEHGLSGDCKVFISKLEHSEIPMVFTDKSFKPATALFYNHPEITHINSHLSKYAHHSLKLNNDILFYCSGKMLQVLVFNNSTLFSINAFDISNEADVLFYALSLLKNLPEDITVDNCYFGGIIDEESKSYQKLKSELPGFTSLKNELPFELAGIQENYFTYLLLAAGCEL